MLTKNFKKNFFWNTLGSGLVSINSLLFLIVTTRINGIENAGIFTLCFASSCMFYCIAIYSGRVYQVTETDKDVTDNEYIINRIITSIIMIFIALLFGWINKYANNKMLILFILSLFKATEAICDVFHGILQKNDRLDIVGKSLLVRSLLNIIAFFVVDILTKSLVLSCVSLVITNVVILICLDLIASLKYKEKNNKFNFSAVFKIFTFGFFTFAFSLMANYLVNIPRYAIDILNNESLQTIFGIIVMPATIIMLMCQFITQPIITKLKELYKNKNKREFLKIVYKLLFAIVIVGILALIMGYLFGIPVLNLLYGLKINNYLFQLIIIMIGATLYTMSSIFSYAMVIFRKTKVQFYIYLIVTILSYFVCNYLVNLIGFNGAVYGYLISMLVLLLLYFVYFITIINKVFENE